MDGETSRRLRRLGRELEGAAAAVDMAGRGLAARFALVGWRSDAARLASAGVEDALTDLRRCGRRFGELAVTATAVATALESAMESAMERRGVRG